MIVAGFGFRSAASADSLREAFARAIGAGTADALATAADKARGDVFQALASALDLPVFGIDPETLSRMETHTKSEASWAAQRSSSLAEAAALAAAGPNARLLTARVVSSDRMATCAIAFGDSE
ncbi:MAG: cobalamin biosynthesis protein [Pseudomonadota bacterium]